MIRAGRGSIDLESRPLYDEMSGSVSQAMKFLIMGGTGKADNFIAKANCREVVANRIASALLKGERLFQLLDMHFIQITLPKFRCLFEFVASVLR